MFVRSKIWLFNLFVLGVLLVIYCVKTDYDTFSKWTHIEEFQEVPLLITATGSISEATDFGNGHYVVCVSETRKYDYKKYLKKLKRAGFKMHSDNGPDAVEGNVMTQSYLKDKLVITVSYVSNTHTTYISASEKIQLSNKLLYFTERSRDVKKHKKTTFHMMELNNNGSCFIIQLKNGHFVIHDGGHDYDAPYLLDYLERLAYGEKPIVEAWFVSHAHRDHHGALLGIMNKKEWRDRINVEGIYFMEPPMEFVEKTKYETYGDIRDLTQKYKLLQNSVGGECKLYRPQFGQRYYFCDMYIDVILTPEQFLMEPNCKKDFNETSIWLMNYIEGQKILIVGDTNTTGMNKAMEIFEKEYFEVDVYAVSHHGINVYEKFTDILQVKTLLYSNWRVGSLWQDGTKYARNKENYKLVSGAKEAYSHENGTVIIEFPYILGEVRTLGPTEWKYNGGRRMEVFW